MELAVGLTERIPSVVPGREGGREGGFACHGMGIAPRTLAHGERWKVGVSGYVAGVSDVVHPIRTVRGPARLAGNSRVVDGNREPVLALGCEGAAPACDRWVCQVVFQVAPGLRRKPPWRWWILLRVVARSDYVTDWRCERSVSCLSHPGGRFFAR